MEFNFGRQELSRKSYEPSLHVRDTEINKETEKETKVYNLDCQSSTGNYTIHLYNLNLRNADTKWRMKPHKHINRKPDFRNILNGYDNLVQKRKKGGLSSESLLGQLLVYKSQMF